MKSGLTFIDFNTGIVSKCGDPLEIEISSADLGWDGVILEKGWSPHFYPQNIITPYFYFAMAIESDFRWSAEYKGEIVSLKTNPGEIWMNPPNIPFTHVIDDQCHFIIFTVEEKTLFKYFDGTLPEQKLEFLQNYNVNDQSLEYFIRLIYNEVTLRGVNGIEYYQSMLKMFSIYYIKNYSNYLDIFSKKAVSSKITESDIGKITEYINNNIEAVITIEELAEICNYSKYYFLKEFNKFTGITPYQYILKIKLEKSRELLQNKDMQIVDVVYMLGFSDQSHFTNSFKKYFGYPPGAFKSR